MKKNRILLIFIAVILLLAGCSNVKENDTEFYILGVNTKDFEKLEVIHGNMILYPDPEQKDKLTIIEDLNTILENNGDNIETINENLGIALADAETYAQNDAENYYAYITFTNKQTLRLNNNSKEEYQNCDGVLIDLNNMKLNWSQDSNFVETMGYTKISMDVESEYAIFLNKIRHFFAD